MMLKYFFVDFTNDIHGIGIKAKNEEEIKKIVENPNNWKDHKPRKIAYIQEIK